MRIPSGISSNRQGFIGVRVAIHGRIGTIELPMSKAHFEDLDHEGLIVYLSNALVLRGISQYPIVGFSAYELPDSSLVEDTLLKRGSRAA